jgi:hypothetical protein
VASSNIDAELTCLLDSVIFVCGPHHNQFLDPLLLMCEVRLSAGRRVSFLIAEKSYHRKFIGLASRIAHSSALKVALSVVRNAVLNFPSFMQFLLREQQTIQRLAQERFTYQPLPHRVRAKERS